jgi:phage FluMu gp28-like protein
VANLFRFFIMNLEPTDVVKIEEDVTHDVAPEALIEQSDLTSDDVAAADELAKGAARGRPAVMLTDYQKRIVTAARKFLSFMICRQGGKTFAATLRIARKLLAESLPYYILSRSERQSGNAIAQLVVHLRAMERALKARGKRVPAKLACSTQKLRYVRADDSALEYRRLTVRLPNGAKAVGLPCSPDTCVGIAGSMYCDEFAVPRENRVIFSRLFPVVSRRKEYEFLVTSTPRGMGDKFHEIMTSPDYAEIFERFSVDIHQAVREGLILYDYDGNPIVDEAGIERLRKALKDATAWDEEYLCLFIDDVLNLLSYELIGRCERQHDQDGKAYEILALPEKFDPDLTDLSVLLESYCSAAKGPLYLGFDQARHKDLSVIWVDEEDAERKLWQRAFIRMEKKDFEFQEAVLWQFMRHPRLKRAGIDSTGLGERTAERTKTKFPGRTVCVQFGSLLQDRRGNKLAAKALLARTILERHQDGLDRYPILDEIREDFHRVKRKRGASPDAFSYFADHDETGHADIFTAKALSDLVAQEMRESPGRVDGMRIVQPETPWTNRLRPDPNEDMPPVNEWAGVGEGML